MYLALIYVVQCATVLEIPCPFIGFGRYGCRVRNATVPRRDDYEIKFDGSDAYRNIIRFVSFINSIVEVVPGQLVPAFPSLKSVQLKGCDVNGRYDDDLLKELTSIEGVFLDRNGVTSISEGAFKELADLKEIYIMNEQLTTLPEKLFQHNPKLKTLILIGNGFTHLAPNSFKFNQELITVDLHRNNLETLPAEIFKNNQKLYRIDLNENQIEKLAPGTFGGLNELDTLEMNKNVCIDSKITISQLDKELSQCYDSWN